MKKKKIHNGVEIMSLAAQGTGVNRGRVRLLAQLEPDAIAPVNAAELEKRLKATGQASMWSWNNGQSKSDNFNFERIEDVLPSDADYIVVPFRAISKVYVPGHCLDFSGEGVLEAAVPLIYGQTVYPNHDFGDINNALGSIAASAWDSSDGAKKGAPGINVQYKIDALMNPRIARLLLMKPPAIHSTSLTLLFEFDFSHPQLVEEGRFWNLLGEEVEGSIVRMVVTKILECWEGSLVFMGADRGAKQIEGDDEDGESFSAKEAETAADPPPPNSNEEKTMKLTTEQKAELGIEFDGEEVPETKIFEAAQSLAAKAKDVPADLAELTANAEAGKKYIELQRAEVTRLAKLAELGSEEGDLDPVVVKQLAAADFETLTELKGYYEKKIGDKFPKDGRSSAENSADVEKAGGVHQVTKRLPKVSVH